MGSFISIGFIYEGCSIQTIKKEIEKLVNYISSIGGSLKKMKVSKDVDGEEWLEYDSLINLQLDSIYTILAENYYAQLEVNSNLFEHKNLVITIRIEKDEDNDYFGFLLDMNEKEIIKGNSVNEINNITERIIDFIIKFYNYSNYNYAICDNEAEIEYSPKDFYKIESSIYSITVIPVFDCKSNSNKFNVIKSNWNIDGLTSRN